MALEERLAKVFLVKTSRFGETVGNKEYVSGRRGNTLYVN